ncbi:J domain-containing protein spf31 [Rhizoctonia solani AG-1 IB]|uniref:J domain-containing protein spf31 n=1 Tax=Thanatephorus cucumeris (strain AG1-IB / isolate 7/3/14) TaxID=1108050 RepID=M5BUB7_THACB|nr:J domain-containing protein spf31 [Rhizoctonia solani AG-1 IB]
MAPSPPPATELVPPRNKDSNLSVSKKEEPSESKSTAQVKQPLSTDELDKLLSREASAFQRDVEVDRILKAFKLSPYEILGLDTTCTPADIKKRYRHLSLFIHPDKATHPRATDAFDLLKKAEADLMDQTKRDELDAVMLEARAQTLKANSLPTGINDTDSRVLALVPSFKEQIRARAKDILIDEEGISTKKGH